MRRPSFLACGRSYFQGFSPRLRPRRCLYARLKGAVHRLSPWRARLQSFGLAPLKSSPCTGLRALLTLAPYRLCASFHVCWTFGPALVSFSR